MSTLRTMEADSSISEAENSPDATPQQQTPTPQHAVQPPGEQAAQTRRRRVPSWLERNGIAAAVITSFAALLVYGFMSLSNQIDSLGDRIDRVEDNLNQRIDRVEGNLNERIDQIDQRFIQIERRFAQIDQQLTDINTILFDHTGRLSRIETTLELGSDATPQT